jgi:hypothetical protein
MRIEDHALIGDLSLANDVGFFAEEERFSVARHPLERRS